MKNIEIFTDGACSGNPGPGGWGALLRYNGHIKEISGGEADTTNNRMELSAAIEALKSLKEKCSVVLTADSSYLVNAFEKGWVYGWEKKNWVKKGQNVPNTDLWLELLKLIRFHDVKFVWIRGHNGHTENERCDELATAAVKKLSASTPI